MSSIHSVALAAALALAAAPAAPAQQRLFTLATDGQVSEVLGFDASTSTLAPVAVVPLAPGTLARGLAADRATGDLFVLTLAGSVAEIRRLDTSSGQLTAVCSLTAPLADGLDARFDGTLVLQESLDTLVLVDPVTCDVTRVPTAAPIGVHTSEGSLAFGPRGLVLALGADGTSQRIDPLDGASSPFGGSFFAGSHSIEVDGIGDVYFGQWDGALFATGTQTRQLLPSVGPAITGLAFLEPADGDGMSIACDGQPNSTGGPSTIEAIGTSIAVDDDLELRCRDLPAGSFGFFLVGPNQGSMPVGSGVLCIATPQFRYSNFVQDAGPAGQVRFALDLTALPSGAPVVAGDTYLFQYWHRDLGPTSNLGPAIAVDFR